MTMCAYEGIEPHNPPHQQAEPPTIRLAGRKVSLQLNIYIYLISSVSNVPAWLFFCEILLGPLFKTIVFLPEVEFLIQPKLAFPVLSRLPGATYD